MKNDWLDHHSCSDALDGRGVLIDVYMDFMCTY